jgi:hypothetical protein
MVKKELYKQKPIAKLIGRGNTAEAYVLGFTSKLVRVIDEIETGDYYYETSFELEGKGLVSQGIRVFFKVPEEEMVNDHNEKILKDEEPAQLLIRWLI